MRISRNTLNRACLAILVAGLALGVGSWMEAGRDPVVVRYDVAVPQPLARPITIALISDTHVSKATRIDVERLGEILARVNALKPDMVVLAGDYILDIPYADYPFYETVQPFRGLKAPLGVHSVLGNHDYDGRERQQIQAALMVGGGHPLVNEAVEAGPVVVAGIDDYWKGDADIDGTARKALTLAKGRPIILISHNPDVFPFVPGAIALTLAGHTHGGQILLPLIGPIVSSTSHRRTYQHGLVHERGHDMVVTSGLGGIPFRLGAPPEIALITLRHRNGKPRP